MSVVRKCDRCGMTEGTYKLEPKTQNKYRLSFTEEAMRVPFEDRHGNKLVALIFVEAYNRSTIDAPPSEHDRNGQNDEIIEEYLLCDDCKRKTIAEALFND